MAALNRVNHQAVAQAPAIQNPAPVAQRVAPATVKQKCSWDKVTRVVLYVLSAMAYVAGGLMVSAFLLGQATLLSAVGYTGVAFLLGNCLSNSAQRAHDYNDSVELAKMQDLAQHLTFRELVAQYQIVDLLRHHIIPLTTDRQGTLGLRERIHLALNTADANSLAFLRTFAREFRERNLISDPLFHALTANAPVGEVNRLAGEALIIPVEGQI